MSAKEATNAANWAMSPDSRARGRTRARGGADLQSKKEAQLRDWQSAMADYQAARRAQRENMERLRTLRLARDAADALRSPAKASAKSVKRRAKRAAPAA